MIIVKLFNDSSAKCFVNGVGTKLTDDKKNLIVVDGDGAAASPDAEFSVAKVERIVKKD